MKILLLEELEKDGLITLGRGNIISKEDMAKNPGDYPVYSSSATENGEFGRYGIYMFEDERITWSIDGGGRLFYRNNHRYSVTNVCGWLKVNTETLITKYVYYCLHYQWLCMKFDYTYKAHPSVIKKLYKIPLLTLDEQSMIVKHLDRINEIIEKNTNMIVSLNDLIESRFVEMFGDVISNDKGWKSYVFSEIASSRLGKMLDGKHQTGESTYHYLANYNVQWFRFELENLNSMDFDEADRREFELRDGDLLVCEGGEIGRCAIWHNELQNCYFQKALHRVRCDRKYILPDYLAWWFKYNCDNKGFATIEGAKATIAHLPGAKLKKLTVVTPPIELQNKFADFVEQTDKLKLSIQKECELYKELLEEKMNKYFY